MTVSLKDVFNLYGYTEAAVHEAFITLAALRGCFDEPNQEAYQGTMIEKEVCDKLASKEFPSYQEGIKWWKAVTQKNWLRSTFKKEGASPDKDPVVNVLRWLNVDQKSVNIQNEHEKKLLEIFRVLKLVDTVPWPKEEVCQVVFHGQMEEQMRERIEFLPPDLKAKVVLMTNARGVFNDEINKPGKISYLAAVLADVFFNEPRYYQPILEVLIEHAKLWTNNIYLLDKMPAEAELKKLHDNYIFTKNPAGLVHVINGKTTELKLGDPAVFNDLIKKMPSPDVIELKAIQMAIRKKLGDLGQIVAINMYLVDKMPVEAELINGKFNNKYIFSKNPVGLVHVVNGKITELKLGDPVAFSTLVKEMKTVVETQPIQITLNSEPLHGFRDIIAANQGHNRGSFKNWLKDLNALKLAMLTKLGLPANAWPLNKGWYYKNPQPFDEAAQGEGRQSLAGWATVMDIFEYTVLRGRFLEVGKFRDFTLGEPVYSVRLGKVATTEDNILDWLKKYGEQLPKTGLIVFVSSNSVHEIDRQHRLTIEILRREKAPEELISRVVTVGPGAEKLGLSTATDVLAKLFFALSDRAIKKAEMLEMNQKSIAEDRLLHSQSGLVAHSLLAPKRDTAVVPLANTTGTPVATAKPAIAAELESLSLKL